nr:uncharacterized protein LOC113713862 [Coffea arabica]
MAESTKYRTLEEQIKKQEVRLQELVETMAGVQAAGQLQFQKELEQRSSRLEALVGTLNQRFDSIELKFNSLLNVMMKEKGCAEQDSRTSEPLLPTPPPHMKLGNQNGTPCAPPENRSKQFHPILPKLEMPMFVAGNPREWLRKCQKYFLNYQIPDNQKVEMVEMFLEGKADNWFQGVKLERPHLSWTEFSDLMCERFSGKGSRDVVEEFNKLQQKGTIEEYEEKFEELKTLMLLRNPKLDELYFVSSFVSGLKEEIRPMVKMFKPQSLAKAFEVAELQECSLEVQARHSRSASKTVLDSRFGLFKNPPNNPKSPSSYRIPAITPNTNKSENVAREFNKISAEEIQYRRKHDLCYRCGEMFGAGHRCKPGSLNCVDLEEGDETDFEDAEGEQDASTGRVGELAEVSLNALNGAMNRKSIILLGNMGGLPVKILVDTGASNSFIHFDLAKSLYLPHQEVTPFTVTLADGTDITSGAICPRVKWLIQDYQFQFDLKVMDLGNWDIILGVDWMYQFSPITFDFHSLSIALSSSGSLLHLQGLINQPVMKLVRGKDLRSFIQEKHRHCAALQAESQEHQQRDIPEQVEAVLQQYSQVFATPTGLPPKREPDHQITLKPGAEPFKLKPYRYPHAHKTEIEKQVAEMLSSGIVIHSSSPFASPVLLVKKKDNSWRLCVDYRKLNELTVKDRFPIPNIDELLNELHGMKYMSKLDLRAGYHQLRVKAMDTRKTAFQTHHGHFEFLVMPFGLTNAPATFQALMNRIFQPYMRKFVLVFFDDILIYSPTFESHLQHLQIVLGVLANNQLFCKRSKCSFAQTSVEYLGHVISENGVSMDKSKIECILSWPAPETVKELRGFLGLTGYYRRFVKGYGVISKPLTQLLKKDGFTWNSEAQMAFEDLKKAMTTAPVLSMPNFELPFVIETDACEVGIGAVLMQQGHPIAFLSKALANQNLGMSVYEKELFALVLAVTKWKHYLVGHRFIIRTDHQALKYLLEQRLTHPLQHKWLTKLLGLDYEIHYKKGIDNGVADALSRRRIVDHSKGCSTESGILNAISSVQPA